VWRPSLSEGTLERTFQKYQKRGGGGRGEKWQIYELRPGTCHSSKGEASVGPAGRQQVKENTTNRIGTREDSDLSSTPSLSIGLAATEKNEIRRLSGERPCETRRGEVVLSLGPISERTNCG